MGIAIDDTRLFFLILRLFDFLDVKEDRPSDSSAESLKNETSDDTALELPLNI